MSTQDQPQADAVREPVTHDLKCWAPYFDAIVRGTKPFEWRKNDRDYRVGDVLCLRRFDNLSQRHTGSVAYRRISYMLTSGFGMPEGYAVLALSDIATPSQPARPAQAVLDAANELAAVVLGQCSGFLSGPGFVAAQAARKLKDALASTPSQAPEPAAQPAQAVADWARDGIADFIADNWPDRKHALEEIVSGIKAIEIRAALRATTPSQAKGGQD